MAADAASATVKVARRINGSRNISRGISESSSPRISCNNSSISRGISENSSTRGISRDISRSSPHSVQGDGVHHAFVSGVVNTDIFCRSAVQYPTHSHDPYTGAQAATYLYSEDYAGFGSGPPPSQSAPAPPDLHGPPVPSELSWSSFSKQASLAQFAPPGKFHVPNESVVGGVTVPGSYLHSAFVVQSGSNEDDVWIADSGASCHMTHDRARMYNARPPPPGRETITIGDRRRIKVDYIGNMNVIFHGKRDQRTTLIDVAYVPHLGFNLYSLHAVQRTHLIVSDASGTHIIGEKLAFPRSSSGTYLRATRLPAGTVGARRRQGEMHATNRLRQLRHPVPPPSSRNVNSHYAKAPWTTPVRTARIKPPRDIYVPMPESVPIAALSPALAAAPLAPAPASTTPPASVLKPPAPIPPRVGRDIKNE